MRLNLIDDAGAESLKSVFRERTDPAVPAMRRYTAELHLGLLAWREGDLGQMKTHLAAAGKAAIEAFSRPVPAGRAQRRPKDFDLPLMMILAFGDDASKQAAGTLSRSAWFQDDDVEYRPLAELLDILRRFPGTKRLDAAEIRKVLESNGGAAAQPWYRLWIQAMGAGLLAIVEKKQQDVEKAIHALLKLHERETEEGDWKLLVQGLMASWALVLGRLARESGIAVKADSPYLPGEFGF
jgi:hypothetical protein